MRLSARLQRLEGRAAVAGACLEARERHQTEAADKLAAELSRLADGERCRGLTPPDPAQDSIIVMAVKLGLLAQAAGGSFGETCGRALQTWMRLQQQDGANGWDQDRWHRLVDRWLPQVHAPAQQRHEGGTACAG